tara:strand:+ start:27767 stop:28003 length:237 start_codon:yes stop_codon:yes gene_type:complete
MNTDKKQTKKIYKETNTKGVTENVTGEQTIQTAATKFLKGKKGKKDKEVLIGKEIEKVDEIEEGYDTLQRRILNKMMK